MRGNSLRIRKHSLLSQLDTSLSGCLGLQDNDSTSTRLRLFSVGIVVTRGLCPLIDSVSVAL